MKKYLPLILGVMILCNMSFSQVDPEDREQNENKDILGSWSMDNTKTIQSYYQNIFSTKSDQTGDELLPSYDIDKEKLIAKLREAVPLQGPIDPTTYLVGPGDIFEITIMGNIPASFTLPVTPEGSIVIPSVGVVDVKEKYLADVKTEVSDLVKTQYRNSEVTATLISPRIFSVSVGGVVNNPGSFYASSVQRVDEVIYLANLKADFAISQVSQRQAKEEQLLNRPEVIKYFRNDETTDQELKMSLRNIKVIRRNGDTLDVDLVRFYATGSVKYNPFLEDGDRIYVPNLSLEGNAISISGEVRLKGTYEYSEHDSLSSVFSIVQGPTRVADLEKVYLYRTDFTTGDVEKKIVNFESILNGKQSDIPLAPGDRIVFRKKYPREDALSVTIKGEVVSPGLYPIQRNSSTIKDIVNEAGGFTDYASLSQARILRFNNPIDKVEENPDYSRLEEMRLGDLNQRMREYFNYESAIKRGYVAVDFKELFNNDNENYDVTLQDGDVIIIPEKQNTVYVFGQVARDGYYDFVDGKDCDYYISLSGGFSEMAQEGYVRVIKAGTKNWVEPDETNVEPGDAIYIPREMDFEDKPFDYYFTWFSRIVSVVAGIATVVLVAISSSK